eukprot:NODE_707_length_4970_cov_0.408335.p3 type:complete len:111 gc:universal NODE_707_length_4970_cov_0.408335:4787-4455(-)
MKEQENSCTEYLFLKFRYKLSSLVFTEHVPPVCKTKLSPQKNKTANNEIYYSVFFQCIILKFLTENGFIADSFHVIRYLQLLSDISDSFLWIVMHSIIESSSTVRIEKCH